MRALWAGSGLAIVILLSSCALLFYVPLEGYKPVYTPISIHDGSLVQIPFAVPMRGVYDIELEYPRAALKRVRSIEEISGMAALSSHGKIVEQRELPRHWVRSQTGWFAIILIRLRAESSNDYVLSLHIKHVPADLKDAQPKLKVIKVGRKFAAQ